LTKSSNPAKTKAISIPMEIDMIIISLVTSFSFFWICSVLFSTPIFFFNWTL